MLPVPYEILTCHLVTRLPHSLGEHVNAGSQAAVIANDLDSMRHRIEALPAYPAYTDALNAVTKAMEAVKQGQGDLHQRGMRKRFAKMDAA